MADRRVWDEGYWSGWRDAIAPVGRRKLTDNPYPEVEEPEPAAKQVL